MGIGKTRNGEIGNGKREMRKWVKTGNGAHRNGNTIFLIKGGEVTESVSEVVTALLEYIRRIRKQLFQ